MEVKNVIDSTKNGIWSSIQLTTGSSFRFYHGGQDEFGFLTDFREEY